MYKIEIELELSDELVEFLQSNCNRMKLDFRLAVIDMVRRNLLFGKIKRKEKLYDDRAMGTDR